MLAQVFFMKLECLKIDLDSKLEFHELKFQKVVDYIFCKQWYIANNFHENSGMLLIIFAKSGK